MAPLFPGSLLGVLTLLFCGSFPAATSQEDFVAARGRGGIEVDVAELDRLLLDRYALSEDGLELLDVLLKAELLEQLAAEGSITVTEEEITTAWNRLDRESRAMGEPRGIAPEIEARGFTDEEFRDFLRLSIIQEKLTRRALDLGEDARVTGAQQEVWLDQEIAARGLERPAPPWEEGLVVRCGEAVVTVEELGSFLRRRLPRESVRESTWHLLLAKGIEKRMPDVSPEARTRAIDEEIARRKAQHQLEYPAITFEQRLGASGRTLDTLRRDPSVHIAALSRLWVDRTAGEDGLRKTYEDERDYFEGLFGKAVQTHLLFLVAGRFVNQLNTRTFEMAEEELAELSGEVGNLDDFEALARQYSEEPNTRMNKGAMGWITSGDPRIPLQIREAVFEFVNTGGKIPASGVAVGPVRLDSGSGLLWVSAVRESPSWEVMSMRVHEELRRRFLEEVMPVKEIEYLALSDQEDR